MKTLKKFSCSILALVMALSCANNIVFAKTIVDPTDSYYEMANGLKGKFICLYNGDSEKFAMADQNGTEQTYTPITSAAALFDGNNSTGVILRDASGTWDGYCKVGDYVGVEFEEVINLTKVTFVTSAGDTYGNPKIEYLADGSTEWTTLKEFSGKANEVTFEGTVSNVKAVRLTSGSAERLWVRLYEIAVEGAVVVAGQADYTEVNKAVNAANALVEDNYLSLDAVEAAVNAVVYDLPETDQATVDGYAAAINAAIAALVQVKFEQANDNITIVEVGNEHNDHRGQELLSNIFDGNPSTLWHTNWDGSDRSTHHFTLGLEEQLYSGIQFLARPQTGADGDRNGVITKLNVYAKLGEDSEWTKVVTERETDADGWQVVNFDAPIRADYIKFEVVEADSTNSKLFASMAELKVNYVAAADYAKVTAALAKVPTDLSGYTVETVEALEEAMAAVIYDLDYSKQADVDAYAAAIETAIKALDMELADYTKLNQQIAIAEALDADAYKDFSAVETALAAAKAVEKDLPITSQADIDALEAALKAAIAALEEKEVELVTTEIPTSEMNVSAGSEQQNNPTEGLAEYAIDGKTNTLWHTDWSGAPRADHWFQVDFDNPKEVNGMKVLQRGGDWPNGRILTYNLLGRHSETGEWFTIIENGRLAENFNWQDVTFEPTEVQALRIVSLTSTTDTGIQFSALAEIRFTETGKVVTPFADYTEVNKAIEAANKLNKDIYVDFTGVETAVAAVVKGLKVTEQDRVDGYAEAINEAIAALQLKDADYSAVNSAIAAAGELNKDHYVDFSAVDAAIAAVVTGYKADKQAEVNAMAKAINDAIAALVKNPADYTKVTEAKTKVPEDLSIYTDETVEAVEEAVEAVVEGLDFTRQEEVNAFAKAIEEAVEALKLKDADYTKVTEALAKVPTEKDNYVDFTAVEEAVEAVVEGLDITKQADVDGYAKAIEDAIAALELKAADYSEVEAAIEAANKLNKDNYKDFSKVEEAIEAVVEGLDITKQDDVDAMAKAIIDAILALEVKDTPVEPEEPTDPEEPETPVQPEKPVDPEQPEEPETPVEPEKPVQPEKPQVPGTDAPEGDDNVNTSDVTSVFGLLSMMMAAVFGMFASRKRKED